METAMKVSTSFRLNADLVESTTLAAIEEAKAQQQAYRDGKTRGLLQALQDVGYKGNERILTPRQVQVIEEFLGEV